MPNCPKCGTSVEKPEFRFAGAYGVDDINQCCPRCGWDFILEIQEVEPNADKGGYKDEDIDCAWHVSMGSTPINSF